MCLGIPMRLLAARDGEGEVELAGVRRRVRLDLVPEAREGEFVLIHAGYAIQVLDEESARETLDAIREVAASGEDGPGATPRGG